MTCHYPDLGSASDWLCRVGNLIQPIRSTTKIRVVTRCQYRISALVSQTSFGRETSGSVAKCRLFSQARVKLSHNLLSGKQNMRAKKICFTLVLIHSPALNRPLQPLLFDAVAWFQRINTTSIFIITTPKRYVSHALKL